MALSWILRDGEVTSVLVGVSKPEQILDNAAIAKAAPLDADESAAIEQILA
jgi:L-glyceraldehyde 3-phosphate reductase